MRYRAVLFGMMMCSLAVAAAAKEPATVRVSADATVAVSPDQAVVEVAVVSESQDADRAARDNAEKVQALLAALRGALGSQADTGLRTLGYSLTPKYTAYQQGEVSKIDGYVATNVVQAVTDDLEGVGKLIDLSLAAGANRVERLDFKLKDEQPVRARALREATQRARQRADAIASALDLEIARVLSVEQASNAMVPMHREMNMMQAQFKGAATQVVPGSLEIVESVVLTAELSQR